MHPRNAFSPTVVRAAGIVISVREVQSCGREGRIQVGQYTIDYNPKQVLQRLLTTHLEGALPDGGEGGG